MKVFTPRYDDPNSLASRLRRRRAERLPPMIVAISVGNRTCSIFDIDGEASYWQTAIGLDDPRELRAHITLLNHTDKYVGTDLDPALFTVVIADGFRYSAFKRHHRACQRLAATGSLRARDQARGEMLLCADTGIQFYARAALSAPVFPDAAGAGAALDVAALCGGRVPGGKGFDRGDPVFRRRAVDLAQAVRLPVP